MAEPSQTDRPTLIEAAALLWMTQDSVRRRILQRHLDGGQEMGRWWYVTRESVQQYIADRKAESQSA